MAHVLQCKRDKLLSLLPVRWNVHHSIDHSLTSDHKQSGRKSHGNNESVCSCFFLSWFVVSVPFFQVTNSNEFEQRPVYRFALTTPSWMFIFKRHLTYHSEFDCLFMDWRDLCVFFFRLLSTSSWSVCFCIWLRFINVISCVHKRRC